MDGGIPDEFERWLFNFEYETRTARGETVDGNKGGFLSLGVEIAAQDALKRLVNEKFSFFEAKGRDPTLSHELRCLIYLLLAYCARERQPTPAALLSLVFVASDLREGCPSPDLLSQLPLVVVEPDRADLKEIETAMIGGHTPAPKATEIFIPDKMPALIMAADLDGRADARLGRPLSVNYLAKKVHVDRKTIRSWRELPFYKKRRAMSFWRTTHPVFVRAWTPYCASGQPIDLMPTPDGIFETGECTESPDQFRASRFDPHETGPQLLELLEQTINMEQQRSVIAQAHLRASGWCVWP
jgi:hypothetical protein